MGTQNLKTLYEVLSNPGSEYRSLPFWGWNDRLQEDELRRQMQDMKAKGIGGCFSHARDGIETPYLSEAWMEATRVMADEAARSGLEAWIYDEDKWPSGSAGGQVAAANPQSFTAKGLTLEVSSAMDRMPVEDDEIIGTYIVDVKDKTIIRTGTGDTRITLRCERSRTSEWYNNSAPADNMNTEAVKTFIRMTHEKYKQALGGSLEGKVEGFFTDEPNVYDFFANFTPGRPWLPWTEDFAEEFTARRGYSPIEGLPMLFFKGEGSAKIRHDYWRTITELFSERFMKQIYDWCEANHMRFTGHILYENDLGYNIRVCGATMPQYRYLHAPGIDLLGEQTREYLTVKQCSSVANQYGRDMVISETYGCTGWEFDIAGQKWLGDWQFAMGITRRCMHMALYSITGCRKRDYPPVFNYQTTWWEDAGHIEDYFARLSACMTTGKAARDILVIHPISSLWTMCASDPDEDLNNIEMNQGWKDPHFTELNRLGEEYNRMAETLTRAHRDFDFGDETILAEIGRADGKQMRVGKGNYSIVIVPKVVSLFKSTVELLRQFEMNGGRIIWVGEAPTMVEGAVSNEAADVYAHEAVTHAADYEQLPYILRTLSGESMQVLAREGGDAKDILTMLRRTGNDAILFAVNHSRAEVHGMRVTLPVNGQVFAYDAWTDKKWMVPCVCDGTKTEFIDTLEPNGSRVYFVEADEKTRDMKPEYPYRHPHYTDNVFAMLGPVAKIRRTALNALTIDMCAYALNGEMLSETMEIWQAQRRIRDRLGMQQVYYNGIPQRYTWLDPADKDRGTPFETRFEFDVESIPENTVYCAVEKPNGLQLECNGEICRLTDRWYVDRAIRMYELPKLRTGKNILRLSGDYTADMELEDIFILGDFAVTIDRVITKEREETHFGDWCTQGYTHYNGALVYTFDLDREVPKDKRIVLRMGKYEGILAKIAVNGREAGVLFGECYREADLTEYLNARENRIEITVVGSPRNLFGPFHRAYDGCSRISWADFRTEGNMFCKGYTLHPYGLMGQIALLAL